MIVGAPDTLTVVGFEVRVIGGLPLLDDVDLGEILGRVHDEVSGEVLVPGDTQRGVGEVAVGVETNEVREVPIVTVDALYQEVVALGGGDAQHVGRFLLDIGGVGHDDVHVVRVDVDHGRGKGREVDQTDAVGLALGEVDVGVLAFVDEDAVWEGGPELDVAWLQHVLHEGETLGVVPDGIMLVG